MHCCHRVPNTVVMSVRHCWETAIDIALFFKRVGIFVAFNMPIEEFFVIPNGLLQFYSCFLSANYLLALLVRYNSGLV